MDPMGIASGAVVLAQVSMSEQWLNWFGSLFGPHALTAIAVIKIIGINIILSGDNAVVIALACRNFRPASADGASCSAQAPRSCCASSSPCSCSSSSTCPG